MQCFLLATRSVDGEVVVKQVAVNLDLIEDATDKALDACGVCYPDLRYGSDEYAPENEAALSAYNATRDAVIRWLQGVAYDAHALVFATTAGKTRDAVLVACAEPFRVGRADVVRSVSVSVIDDDPVEPLDGSVPPPEPKPKKRRR